MKKISNYSFVVGESNRNTYEIIKSIFNGTKRSNPVIITGPTGVGKTHLLVEMSDNHSINTAYMCTSEIINELVVLIKKYGSIENKYIMLKDYLTQNFDKYDIIVIDNLHIISGKPSTQSVFFEIINTFVGNNKQLIFLTDMPAEEYDILYEKIKESFKEIIICKIDRPDYELKRKIVNIYAENSEVSLENEAVDWLTNSAETIPYIIGAIKKISAVSESKRNLSLSTITNILREK